MESAGGVAIDAAATRRTHWRGALIGVGVAVAAGLLTLFAPQSAHADDGSDTGAVSSLVQGLASTASGVTDPVLVPLPDARDLPVAGGLVGEVVDSAPADSLVQPVTGLADGILGDAAGSLPLVGGLLGTMPTGSIADTVGGAVDGVLGRVAGAVSDADAVPGVAAGVSALWLGSSLVGIAGGLTLISHAGPMVGVGAAGAEGPFPGPVSAPGDITPTSAVTTGGPPIGLAAAVLGAGLLFLLAAGRVRSAGSRVPPSPVFATDTSPD